jgi:RNase adaptor protein for sRNA GlmZ degradation
MPNIEQEHEASGWGWFKLDNLPEDLMPAFEQFLDKKKRIVNNLIRKFQSL